MKTFEQWNDEMRKLNQKPFGTACEIYANKAWDAALELRMWQPIETAPKDETQILAYAKSERFGNLFYGVAEWATKKDSKSVAGWFWPYAIRPTHWMPLPATPTA